MTFQPKHEERTGGICEKMTDLITVLTDSSIRMRDALIHRRSDEIWKIMSDKQQNVAELEQYIVLWNQMYGDNTPPQETELGQQRLEIRSNLEDLQRHERMNAQLSQSYLSAIRKALGQAGTGLAVKKNVYTKQGKYGKQNRSLLIKQFG